MGARARAQVGAGALGALAGARQGERVRGRGRQRRAGGRGGSRQGQAGARRPVGWAAWALPGRAAGPSWVFGAPDSVFGLV